MKKNLFYKVPGLANPSLSSYQLFGQSSVLKQGDVNITWKACGVGSGNQKHLPLFYPDHQPLDILNEEGQFSAMFKIQL